jgi:hypothetical protein
MMRTKEEYKKIYCERLQMEAQAELAVQQQAMGKPPQVV